MNINLLSEQVKIQLDVGYKLIGKSYKIVQIKS